MSVVEQLSLNLRHRRAALDRNSAFRRTMAFERRRSLCEKLRDLHPDRLPLILVRVQGSAAPHAQRSKLLVPGEYTMGQVLLQVRQTLEPRLQPHEAIYLFVGKGVLVPTSETVQAVFERFKDEDGFLYVHYGGENTFGQQ